MRVSIEWFLLDNFLMNMAVLLLAAAISGLRLYRIWGCAISLLAALYALIALSKWNVLLYWPFRVLLGLFLTLGLRFRGWRAFLRAGLCVYGSALLLGGLFFALSFMEGKPFTYGYVSNGVLIGSVRTRIVLIAAPIMALSPRAFRHFRSMARVEETKLRLRITDRGQTRLLTALLDTGNLLTEPITNLPVVLLSDCFFSGCAYPVPFSGVSGTGEMLAYRPERTELFVEGQWQDIDVMLAQAPERMKAADAIIGSIALPASRKQYRDIKKEETQGA